MVLKPTNEARFYFNLSVKEAQEYYKLLNILCDLIMTSSVTVFEAAILE